MEHLSYLSLKIFLFQLYWKEVNTEWNYCEAEKIRLLSQVIVQAETRQLIHKDLSAALLYLTLCFISTCPTVLQNRFCVDWIASRGSRFPAFKSESQYHFNGIFRTTATYLGFLTPKWSYLTRHCSFSRWHLIEARLHPKGQFQHGFVPCITPLSGIAQDVHQYKSQPTGTEFTQWARKPNGQSL